MSANHQAREGSGVAHMENYVAELKEKLKFQNVRQRKVENEKLQFEK